MLQWRELRADERESWYRDKLRRDFPALTEEDAPLDPTRLTLLSPDGLEAQAELEGRNVWPEMADPGHVVLIPTCADTAEDLSRLRRALEKARLGPCPAFPPPPELPERVLTPRQALFAPGKDLPLDQAEGAPVVAPGERIGKKTIAYLKEIGYNGESLCRVCARRG